MFKVLVYNKVEYPKFVINEQGQIKNTTTEFVQNGKNSFFVLLLCPFFS